MSTVDHSRFVIDETATSGPESESRYDRQERVTWWDQELLRQARILVVGAGALGNEVVKNLALMGVGDVVVVDIDVVEMSNLARCALFRAEDEGLPKATVVAARAGELNPDITITGIVGDIRSFGTGTIERCDVLVGALDNREARLYCNRLAARTRRHWVDGAIEALTGVARVFNPPTCCYECTLSEADWKDLARRQSCRLLTRPQLESGRVPTTASTSSIVAGIEVQEVIKLLHKDRPGVQTLSGAIVFEGATNDAYPLAYPTDPDCYAHHHFDDAIRLNLDESSFSTMTAERLAEIAWPDVQRSEAAPILLELGDDHVVGWHCTNCGREDPEHRSASLISWGDSSCPSCGDGRLPQAITQIAIPGPWAESHLKTLGVRHDEMFPVRSGLEERYVWLSIPDPRLPATWSANASNPMRAGHG
jgi:adenylyltransferase/sulfurtransferase